MSAKILAATVLVLLVATLCTLAYALGDALRWAVHASRYKFRSWSGNIHVGNRPI